jgi:hypothetical protein
MKASTLKLTPREVTTITNLVPEQAGPDADA